MKRSNYRISCASQSVKIGLELTTKHTPTGTYTVPNTLLVSYRPGPSWVCSGQGHYSPDSGWVMRKPRPSLQPLQSVEEDLAFSGPAQDIQVRAQVRSGIQAHRCLPISVVFGEVFLAVIHIGFDGVTAGLPASRTDFPMLICILKGLDKAESLIYRASHR